MQLPQIQTVQPSNPLRVTIRQPRATGPPSQSVTLSDSQRHGFGNANQGTAQDPAPAIRLMPESQFHPAVSNKNAAQSSFSRQVCFVRLIWNHPHIPSFPKLRKAEYRCIRAAAKIDNRQIPLSLGNRATARVTAAFSQQLQMLREIFAAHHAPDDIHAISA